MMNSNYVYKLTEREPGLWTVGFYDPEGQWQPESDHSTREAAAARVHYLNGGMPDGDDLRGAADLAYRVIVNSHGKWPSGHEDIFGEALSRLTAALANRSKARP